MTRSRAVDLLLLLGAVALVVVPLVLVGGEFSGTDGAAVDRITAGHPEYRPWAAPLAELPPEVLTGLFALQAALGAGLLGYCLGVVRTKRRLRGASGAADGTGGTGG